MIAADWNVIPLPQRSGIRDRSALRQIKEFGKLVWGSIRPSDMDLLLEWKNRAYVLGEIKHVKARPNNGQRLALLRLCDDLSEKKPCLLFYAEHDVSPELDIDVAACSVSRFRFRNNWRTPRKTMTVWWLMDRFVRSDTVNIAANHLHSPQLR